MAYPVKFFDNTMAGAPVVAGGFGDLIALLDAVLVTGFNLKSITGLTSVGGIARAEVGAGHGFRLNQILLISGVNQSEYNGEVRVTEVTSTSFSYAVSGSPVSPATTALTITVRAAPLNFGIEFSASNKRVYRSKSLMSNRPFLRVDCSPSTTCPGGEGLSRKGRVTMAEAMPDIDTFTGGRAPYRADNPNFNEVGYGEAGWDQPATVGGYDGWYKWYTSRNGDFHAREAFGADVSGKVWSIVGDDRGFFLTIQMTTYTGYGSSTYAFTDFTSYRAGDAYNTLLCASDWGHHTYSRAAGDVQQEHGNYFARTLEFTGKVLMRDHTQVGGNTRAAFVTLGTKNGQILSGNDTGIGWPNSADYGLLLHPTYLFQEAGGLRGQMPGLYFVHNNQPYGNLQVIKDVIGYPGKTFLMIATSVEQQGMTGRIAFDITGPWW